MINIGDIVNVSDSAYLHGNIKDLLKIDLQVFEYDRSDKHYQLHYKDNSNVDWSVWVPASIVSIKWEYNFWLKRKKLQTLIAKNRKPTIDMLRASLLSDDKLRW